MNHPECRACPLSESVQNIGIGYEGHENPDVLFVLEAPGADEDDRNRPCVGKSGQFIRDYLQGYFKSTWGLTNSVRCRPTLLQANGYRQNRKPSPGEVQACMPWLVEDIIRLNPKIIAPLGDTALTTLLGKAYRGVEKWCGTIIEEHGRIIIPSYHPAHVLRMFEDVRSKVPHAFNEHLQLIDRIIQEGVPREKELKIFIPETPSELREAIQILHRHDYFAFDTETNTMEGTPIPTIWHTGAKMLSIAFAWSETEAMAIPAYHRESTLSGCPELLEIPKILTTKKLCGHNIKFDAEVVYNWGKLWITTAQDSLLAHYLLEEERGTQGLEDLMRKHEPSLLRHKVKIKGQEAELKAKSRKNGGDPNGYENIPIADLLYYNAIDAIATFRLMDRFRMELQTDYPKRWTLFTDLYMPVSDALAKIEGEGLLPDIPVKNEIGEQLTIKLNDFYGKIQRVASRYDMLATFNPGSTKQLATLLFTKMGLPVYQETPKGAPSTSEDALVNLRHKVKKEYRDFIDLIVSHIDDSGEETESFRSISKLLSTYINPFEEYIGADGRIHGELLQAGTETNRLACRFPNLQQLPKSMRVLYVAPEGYTVLEADAEQIELRAAALLAKEERMKALFRLGTDIHNETGQMIFNKQTITETERRESKATSFGILFQETAFGLANKLRITEPKAQGYIDRFYNLYPAIRGYCNDKEAFAKEHGYVELPWGNIRHLRGIHSNDQYVYQEAVRQAINSPIQSWAGLYCLWKLKELMALTDETFKIVLTVHDSIIAYVRTDTLDYWVPFLKHILEDTSTVPLDIDIPILWKIKCGPNLKNLKEHIPTVANSPSTMTT